MSCYNIKLMIQKQASRERIGNYFQPFTADVITYTCMIEISAFGAKSLHNIVPSRSLFCWWYVGACGSIECSLKVIYTAFVDLIYVCVFFTIVFLLFFFKMVCNRKRSVNSVLTSKIMKTSSNVNILRVTGHLCTDFTSYRWIPRTKASDADFRLNKRLSKQSRDWWFETPSRPLWRHRNDIVWNPFTNRLTLWKKTGFNNHPLISFWQRYINIFQCRKCHLPYKQQG